MQNRRTPLQVEELGARVLPSVSPLTALGSPAGAAAHAREAASPAPAFDGLDGTVRGSLRPAAGNPDLGRRYDLDGHGSLGGLGSFHVTGYLLGTGFLAGGHAGGELTLTDSRGTIKLTLVGDSAQGAFAPLPAGFHFTVTGGTGAYKGLHEDGEVSLHQQHHGGTTAFQLVFA
jgi:hypothetical protein